MQVSLNMNNAPVVNLPFLRYQDDPCNEYAPGDDFVKFESFFAKIVFARRLAGSLECGGNDGC